MQQIMPHRKFKDVIKVDENEYNKVVYERKEKLELYARLRKEGCSEKIALEAIKTTRATFYRWKKHYKLFGLAGLEDTSRRPNKVRQPKWSPAMEKRIYYLRKKYSECGKYKIAVLYERYHGEKISASTTGRIIDKLVKQGKILPVRFLYGKKDTRNRIFNGHAQRWKRGMQAKQAGELIQIDHMTIQVPGQGYVKHFNAICPITKIAVQHCYREATSANAADFLGRVIRGFPFKVISAQVDGGAEFMGDFENACKKSKIPLWVLPPRSPEYNAHVERSNGTFKYEFYSKYEGATNLYSLQKALQKYVAYYNQKRPHQSLGYLTPCQFYESIKIEA